MVVSKFISMIEKKQNIQQFETAELKTIIEKHPYFQAARALYLKGLKNQNSFKYNNELKVTASFTSDRTVLFNYITSKNFENSQKELHQQISEKILEQNLIETSSKPITNITERHTDVKKELGIGLPILFSSKENHSFNEWMQISTRKPIKRGLEKQAQKPVEKEKLINTFIKNNPKIQRLSKEKVAMAPVVKDKQDSSLMTETLAKVYLEQKKFENAIQAYRILSLKYPEKSGFFADQIKRIQILQKNKS
jgi:hypothetical protein